MVHLCKYQGHYDTYLSRSDKLFTNTDLGPKRHWIAQCHMKAGFVCGGLFWLPFFEFLLSTFLRGRNLMLQNWLVSHSSDYTLKQVP